MPSTHIVIRLLSACAAVAFTIAAVPEAASALSSAAACAQSAAAAPAASPARVHAPRSVSAGLADSPAHPSAPPAPVDTLEIGTAAAGTPAGALEIATADDRDRADTLEIATANDRGRADTLEIATANDRGRADTLEIETAGDRVRSDTLTHRLGEITVTASRLEVAAGAAAQRVTILDQADIERSSARSLADLLEARAGLFVRRYGEGLATVTLRGASPSQTLVLLDGLRLSDPQLGQIDLSLLPTHALGSVEVLHGPGSALHGSDGVGGIINLRPRAPGGSGLRLVSEIGAFGERRAGGSGSLASADAAAGLVVAAELSGADGDFPYLNETLFPAREMRRRNAARTTRSLYASGYLTADRHRLGAGVLYADADRGLPGLSSVAPSGQRQWDEHVRVWMTDEIRLEPATLILRGFVHGSALRYADPGLEIDDTGRTLAASVEGEIGGPVGRGWMADGGLSAGYARAEHPSLSRGASEGHGSAFGELVGRFGRMTLFPALRVDLFTEGPRGALSPRVGMNLRLASRPAIRLKGSAGRSFRNPTFNERYWQPGGNPDLRPERGWSYEAGLFAATAGATLEATAFASRTRDQILWLPEARGMWIPQNLTRAASTGVEASLRAVPLRPARRADGTADGGLRVDGGATYTFTRAVDRSESGRRTYGRQLRYVPRHQLKGFAGLAFGALRLDVSARLIGRRFVTADESEPLPRALVVDLQAGLHRTAGPLRLALSVFVENVLDRDYALIQHYPMPPRHARLRLVIQTAGGS